ncbi:MAG: hypothetical protein J0I06_20490 [Planctomycetes bacterium]|nr:hypothetical protein [Planctomycetota bacterium]
MARITLAELQPLMEQFAGGGTVLSCYADLGVREGFRPNWEAPFKAGADALWKAVGEDGRARRELTENLSAVRRALEAAAGTARWTAVFSATERGFFRAIPLDVPVGTELVLDRSPYLVPLLGAIHRRREYLAVHTDTHRGRLYAVTPAAARLLAAVEGDVPKHQHSAGERYGYGQATIARHREERVTQYHKELAREVEKAWGANGFAGIVLIGEHEVLEHFRAELPPRLAARVIHTMPGAWTDEPAQTEDEVRSVGAELFDEQEAEVAPEFWDLLRQGKAVTGKEAVLSALQSGRIGAAGHGYLVLGPDSREVVGRCAACRTLSAEPFGACPRCQTPSVPGNLWEEVLLTALQHGITIRFVSDPRKLDPYGGAVAVLPKLAPKEKGV